MLVVDGGGFFSIHLNFHQMYSKMIKEDDTAHINGSIILHIFELKRWCALSCMSFTLYTSIPMLKS